MRRCRLALASCKMHMQACSFLDLALAGWVWHRPDDQITPAYVSKQRM